MKKFNLGFIVKLLALAALILLGVFIYVTCSGSSGCGCQRIDKTLPDTSTAPFRISTRTHIYYSRLAVDNKDGSVTMTDWYENIKNRWELHPGTETIPVLFKPRVERR